MKRLLLLILSVLGLMVLISDIEAQNEELITRISVASDGTEGNGVSYSPSTSSDSHAYVFTSQADNLILDDTNEWPDVFVHEALTSRNIRVSVSTTGIQGDQISSGGQLSADGRYVAFISYASNLVPNDTNGESDIFVHDLETSTTKRVSIASDRSQANHLSRSPNISRDGRIIVFTSLASNLVENDKNDALDIFVHDQQTGETSLVSVTPSGTSGSDHSDSAVISEDGRFIAFESRANDLACCSSAFDDIFVRDMRTTQTTHISKAVDGGETNDSSATAGISADGRYILFSSLASNLVENDTNDYCAVGGSPNPSCRDIFVYDQKTAIIKRVSVASDGTQTHDESYAPTISPDGRYVAFWSEANNLSPHDNNPGRDLFVHDLTTGETKLVSIGVDGSQGKNGTYSGRAAFNGDSTLLVFASSSSNLVLNDTNQSADIFVSHWQEVTRIYRLHLPLVNR